MAQQEKFNYYYTFQSTKFSNGIYNFDSIFYILFYFKKPFYAPCVLRSWASHSPHPRCVSLRRIYPSDPVPTITYTSKPPHSFLPAWFRVATSMTPFLWPRGTVPGITCHLPLFVHPYTRSRSRFRSCYISCVVVTPSIIESQRFRSPSRRSLVLLFFPSTLVPHCALSTTLYVLDPRVAFTFSSCLDLIATPPRLCGFEPLAPRRHLQHSCRSPISPCSPRALVLCSGGSLPTEEDPQSLSCSRSLHPPLCRSHLAQ